MGNQLPNTPWFGFEIRNLQDIDGYALVDASDIQDAAVHLVGLTYKKSPIKEALPIVFESEANAALYLNAMAKEKNDPNMQYYAPIPTRIIKDKNIQVYFMRQMVITCEHCGGLISEVTNIDHKFIFDEITIKCPKCNHEQTVRQITFPAKKIKGVSLWKTSILTILSNTKTEHRRQFAKHSTGLLTKTDLNNSESKKPEP